MSIPNSALLLEEAFDLDPENTDLSTLVPAGADSEPCTGDNCGQSPTTGHTTGCATPDSLAPRRIDGHGGCNLA